MKLTLVAKQKSPVEFSMGNLDVRMEPGEVVEVEDAGFAGHLLSRPEVKRADVDEKPDEEMTTTVDEVESAPPTPRQRSEKRANRREEK